MPYYEFNTTKCGFRIFNALRNNIDEILKSLTFCCHNVYFRATPDIPDLQVVMDNLEGLDYLGLQDQLVNLVRMEPKEMLEPLVKKVLRVQKDRWDHQVHQVMN